MDAAFAQECLDAARTHADEVLRLGRDPLGTGTPLFCDGLLVDSLQPARWCSGGQEWILSNLASQQQLLRLLDALTTLTGSEVYREAAEEAVKYALTQCRVGPLLSWGGHMAWDLRTDSPIFAANKGQVHELKRHYPNYALMHRVAPQETCQLIEGMWQAHVIDWSSLEFSRHGYWNAAKSAHAVWEADYADAPVFFEGTGLTFCNAGSDLYYAAAQLSKLTGEGLPLTWAKRLSQRYVQTQHPETGLTGYQFSLSILPPGSPSVPEGRGDRAREQLGGQLAAFAPTEATVMTPKQLRTLLGPVATCRLRLAEALGGAGADFLEHAHEELLAWGRRAFDPDRGIWLPMLTCGMSLETLVLERSGYYGPAGSRLEPLRPDGPQLLSYALAFRLTNDPLLWTLLGGLFRALGLAQLSDRPDGAVVIQRSTGCADPTMLVAVLELFWATGRKELLELACRVGSNLLRVRRQGGFFVGHGQSSCFRLDRQEPVALLLLAEALCGREGRIEPYSPGLPHFEAWHDLAGETSDEKYLYSKRVVPSESQRTVPSYPAGVEVRVA